MPISSRTSGTSSQQHWSIFQSIQCERQTKSRSPQTAHHPRGSIDRRGRTSNHRNRWASPFVSSSFSSRLPFSLSLRLLAHAWSIVEYQHSKSVERVEEFCWLALCCRRSPTRAQKNDLFNRLAGNHRMIYGIIERTCVTGNNQQMESRKTHQERSSQPSLIFISSCSNNLLQAVWRDAWLL